MDFLRDSAQIDAIVPGASEAYKSLQNTQDHSLYTSLGRFYNHTLFGRDAGMTTKFVSDFDHQTAWGTICALASCQGVSTNRITQEEPGRIHHELRDYTTWESNRLDTFALRFVGRMWGAKNKQLLTYFSADATATYIRLVGKYIANIDASILERRVPQREGGSTTLGASIAAAANWIVAQVDNEGVFYVRRSNHRSLPYQTFADSVTAYAWGDGSAADTSSRHSFVEVQAYAMDALTDAAAMLPESQFAAEWKTVAQQMQKALFDKFWNTSKHTFVPGLFMKNGKISQLDTDMVTMGWVLNASFWRDDPDMKNRARIIALVQRLFADDFLTDVGIRTKSRQINDPLGKDVDYHGSRTVWPMFNFMIIEGLRQHGLYRLARQLECRLLNGINAVGHFPEFCIVEHDGTLYAPDKHAKYARGGQMIPEQNIAFTVVPAITLAFRHMYRRHDLVDSGWQYDLEQTILAKIPDVTLQAPELAAKVLSPKPLRIRRAVSGLRSAWHILPVIIK